jgi:hypothetical protein
MSSNLTIKVILGTTREGRFAFAIGFARGVRKARFVDGPDLGVPMRRVHPLAP